MSIQNILLLYAGVINIIMSILVFTRGVKHNKVNLYFSLLTFFNFLWAIGLFLSRITLFTSDIWFFYSASTYFSALGIILSLYLFSVFFPFKGYEIPKILKYFLIVIPIFFIFSFFLDGLFFNGYEVLDNIYILHYNNIIYLFYTLFFVLVAILAIKNFFKSYISAEPFFKKQIKYLLLVIIPGLFFGAYFDLFLCYFGIFNYNWLGPFFTLPINFMAFHIIFFRKHN